MGQISSIGKAKRPDSKIIHTRINHVFEEIKEDIKNGKPKLRKYRNLQNVSKRDVEILQQTLKELKDRYKERIQYLDPKNEFNVAPKPRTPHVRLIIPFYTAIEKLETECDRWPTLINNMKDRRLAKEENQYVIVEMSTTKEMLVQLHRADIDINSGMQQRTRSQNGRNLSTSNAEYHGKTYQEASALSHESKQGTRVASARQDSDLTEIGATGINGGVARTMSSVLDNSVDHSTQKVQVKNSIKDADSYANVGKKQHEVGDNINQELANGDARTGHDTPSSSNKEHTSQETHRVKKMEKMIDDLKHDIRTLTNERDQARKDNSNADRRFSEMKKSYDDLNQERNILAKDVSVLNINLKDAKHNRNSLNEQIESLKKLWHDARKHNAELKSDITKLEQENKNILTRFSKLAGEKLSENNPNIADLSDMNRPTKLGEMYSELYDNEWTDAYDELLKAGYDDAAIINTLKTTLEHTFDFCEQKSLLMKKKIHDAVNLLCDRKDDNRPESEAGSMKIGSRSKTSMSQQYKQLDPWISKQQEVFKMRKMWTPRKEGYAQRQSQSEKVKTKRNQIDVGTKVQKLEKEIAESVVPIVQKEYLDQMWDQDCVPAMKPFIKKCLYLCWMMIVQSPPMCFATDPKPGELLDTNVYRKYLSSEKFVDYVVWPALRLHKGGPFVHKGVAQTK